MQVDPIKPTLNSPGNQRLKLEHDEALASFALKVSLRRYTKATKASASRVESERAMGRGLHSFPFQLNLSSSVHRITQIDS